MVVLGRMEKLWLKENEEVFRQEHRFYIGGNRRLIPVRRRA